MMVVERYSFLLLMIMQCIGLLAVAQPQVSVQTGTTSITTAEPLLATITIKNNVETKLVIKSDTLGAWWILERKPPTVTKSNNETIITETLLITCLDSGSIPLPSFQIIGSDSLFTSMVNISVKPPPADSLLDFKPLKEWKPIQQDRFSYWWLIPVVLAAIALWWYLKKKNKGANVAADTVSTPAADEWQLLLQQWEEQKISSEELGNRWMDLMRKRMGMPRNKNKSLAAFEMVAHAKTQMPSYQLKELVVYLTICQAAQFGKLDLDQSSGSDMIAFGKRWQMGELK